MFTVTVPATLANLGPGFDVLGLAVGVRNTFAFEPAEAWSAEGTRIEPEAHLTLWTAHRAAAHFGGVIPPLAVRQIEQVPRSRGMGSSATARVAGLAAALHYTGLSIPKRDQLEFLVEQEGHPDNVVPAAVGGLTLCGQDAQGLRVLRLAAPDLAIGLLVPRHEVSTPAAREKLPALVPHADAVHNISATAFLIAGLLKGDAAAIAAGLDDRLHQPYRAELIGPIDEAFAAAREAGAFGACVSGSGSTLAALAPSRAIAGQAARAMQAAFERHHLPGDTRVTQPVQTGLRVED
jgi:homoserine kinase